MTDYTLEQVVDTIKANEPNIVLESIDINLPNSRVTYIVRELGEFHVTTMLDNGVIIERCSDDPGSAPMDSQFTDLETFAQHLRGE